MLIILFLVAFCSCRISFNPLAYGKNGEYIETFQNEKTDNSTYFENKIDHFNLNVSSHNYTWKYEQRFWKDDQFYQSGGPNFLYVCGEWVCSKANVTTAPIQFGKSLNAMIWTLEHRFYGRSQPMGDFSVESLKFLNTTQALADIACFIEEKNKTNPGPWVVLGGSYPGALVAWFKNVYPNHAVAAWSSSGVINPIENFKMFDADIYLSTNKSSPECPKIINLMTSDIERQLKFGDDKVKLMIFNTITNQTLTNATEIPNIGDFMWFISDIFTMGVQYGGRVQLCNLLTNGTMYNKDTGFFNYTEFAIYAKKRNTHIDQYDAKSLSNNIVQNDHIARQWTWQYCTEFGWFQEPNTQYPTRSQLLNHDFWLDYCKRIFSMNLVPPAIGYAHQYYGTTTMNASNIVFNNAIEDPWQYAGMRSIPYPSYQTELFTNLIDCEDCGHCIDFHKADETDAQSLKDARQNTIQHITKWLGENQGNNLK